MKYDKAVRLICDYEGCVLTAYKDPVGIPTIGYGHTGTVRMGQVITQAEAAQLLADDLAGFVDFLKRVIKVPTSENEFCAMLSLCYNIGGGHFMYSTLLRKLNTGAPRPEVADEFTHWRKSGGNVLPGLVARRAAERLLFLTPELAAPPAQPVA